MTIYCGRPRDESVTRITAKLASSRFYGQALGLITAFLRPKLLTPELFGLWTLLKIIPTYSSYGHLGSRTSVRFLIPLYKGKQEHDRANAIRDTGLSTSLLFNFLVASVLIAICFKPGLQVEVRAGFITMAVVVLLQCFYDYYAALLKANEQFSLMASLNYLKTTTTLVLTIPLLYFLGVYGLYLTLVLTYVVAIAGLGINYSLQARLRFHYHEFKGLIAKGFPIMLIGLCVLFIITADRLIVSYFLGNKELGYYGIATMAFAFLRQVPKTTKEVLEPRMMRALSSSSSETIVSEYLLKPLINTAYLMPFLIGAVFFLFPVVIPLILPRYASAIVPAQVLTLGAYFLAMSHAPRMIIVANNWQIQAALLLPVVLMVNIGLSVFLLQKGLGLLGVALGTSVSLILLFLVLFVLVAARLETKGGAWGQHVMGMVLPFPIMCVTMAILFYLLPTFIANDYIAACAGVIGLYVIMFRLHRWASKKYPLLKGLRLPAYNDG